MIMLTDFPRTVSTSVTNCFTLTAMTPAIPVQRNKLQVSFDIMDTVFSLFDTSRQCVFKMHSLTVPLFFYSRYLSLTMCRRSFEGAAKGQQALGHGRFPDSEGLCRSKLFFFSPFH